MYATREPKSTLLGQILRCTAGYGGIILMEIGYFLAMLILTASLIVVIGFSASKPIGNKQ